MDRKQLTDEVESGKSTRKIAIDLNVSHSSVRRWMLKYGLKSKLGTSGKKGVFRNTICVLCGRKTVRGMRLCESCQTKIRRYQAKKAAVDLLGGACARCGWKGGLSGLEFHHTNDDKDFGIGTVANKKWEVVKREVLKCELICSCCHRLEHSGYEDEDFLREAARYHSRILGD